jgi:hypothetical protein
MYVRTKHDCGGRRKQMIDNKQASLKKLNRDTMKKLSLWETELEN